MYRGLVVSSLQKLRAKRWGRERQKLENETWEDARVSKEGELCGGRWRTKGGKSGESAFARGRAEQMAIESNEDVFPIEVMFGKGSGRPLNTEDLAKLFFFCPQSYWSQTCEMFLKKINYKKKEEKIGHTVQEDPSQGFLQFRPLLLNSDSWLQPNHLKFNEDVRYFPLLF